MAKHRTYKGKVVDFEDIVRGKDSDQAVGNANMNARGDILDEHGRVKQTKEDRAREYNKNVSNSVIKSSLLDEVDEDLPDLSSASRKKSTTQKRTESKQSTKKQDTESSAKAESTDTGENIDSKEGDEE